MTTTLDTPVLAGEEREARPRRRSPLDRERPAVRVAAWVTIIVFGGFALLPVYWMLATALTPDGKVFAYPPALFPADVTFEHFASLAGNSQLFDYLVNSAIVSGVTAVLSVIVSAYMAYSFSKYRYRGRRSLMYLVLSSQMFPQALLLVTLYAVFDAYDLLNTYTALVLSFTTFTLPLCVWMLKGFFDTIPDSLIEAARIDGASQLRIIHSVIVPLSVPGLVAAGLFAFVRGWNDFIFALTLAGPDKQTLPPGLANTYLGEAQTAWPELMAASLVVSLPVVIAFIALQRFLVGGITAGAVKG
ncbi:carbohydrate ABC transporter permease [Actinophytocola algeriensis]|uniref:Multiple sugar transport system permease protein n=1 Tax=Actinophytocola algeriensis TaxID=1768010 RepID=A0A7W7Q1N8_9PSEU|nr:carbohydrate ABC transporter permease [Actinophytocola algeriensis]MBB4905375.1 multiple sugar transport system permease protein [Actinophytocola algeriensis]MBE1472940.1 multiple sugar transport system permease protein [Actinophytocola algeriensis]